MNETTNLHLPQFEETDRIHHDDFNDAFAAIDAAMPHIALGTYAGTGECGEEHPNTLTFDFAPKFVLIRIAGVEFIYGLTLFSPLAYGTPSHAQDSIGSGSSVRVSWSGKSVSWYNESSERYQMNDSGETYYYLAIG